MERKNTAEFTSDREKRFWRIFRIVIACVFAVCVPVGIILDSHPGTVGVVGYLVFRLLTSALRDLSAPSW